MERAIIYSDLKKEQFQPHDLLDKYLELLDNDISELLIKSSLNEIGCPVIDEKEVKGSFDKKGMNYQISKTLGNIYLSPRPSMVDLKKFYLESTARNYWLNTVWAKTAKIRKEKIIKPQLDWVHGFLLQYLNKNNFSTAELLPNNIGYLSSAKESLPKTDYYISEPLFDIESLNYARNILHELEDNSMDAIFLFEALDRSPNPYDLLEKTMLSLKNGGLCFITCLLSSGFEVQVLGQDSEIFVPPERMNILSFEGMNALIKKFDSFEVLEFSTPGVLDISNVEKYKMGVEQNNFLKYIFNTREDDELKRSFLDFLQMHRLLTFGRLVLKKSS